MKRQRKKPKAKMIILLNDTCKQVILPLILKLKYILPCLSLAQRNCDIGMSFGQLC